MVVTLEIFRVTMLAVSAHNKFVLFNVDCCSFHWLWNKYPTIRQFSHFTSPTFRHICTTARTKQITTRLPVLRYQTLTTFHPTVAVCIPKYPMTFFTLMFKKMNKRFLLFQQGNHISDHFKWQIHKRLMVPFCDPYPQFHRMDHRFCVYHVPITLI